MKTRTLLTLLSALICTFTVFAAPPPDAEATRLLAGRWISPKTPGEDGVFTTFKPDGTFAGEGTFALPEGRITLKMEGKWRVEQGILFEEITGSSHPQYIPLGLVTRDILISVTDKEVRYRTEKGRESSCIRASEKPVPALQPNKS